MDVLKEQILEQIDAVLEWIETVMAETDHYVHWSYDAHVPGVVWERRNQARVRVIAALERLAPAGTAYREGLQKEIDLSSRLVGRLRALRADVEAGYTRRVEELLHAEVFADFLEMAEELREKGYKDPAAVIAGTVLEEHLRKLSARNNIATETDGKAIKAESVNADLAKHAVYNKLDQKNITAWLDLRNKAAHGQYDQYDSEQVGGLIREVRGFLTRNPA